MTSDVSQLTFNEALDRVISIRKGYNACNGSLYKNVAVNVMQDFLESCIEKWGREPFMTCVKREYLEELCGEDAAKRQYGDEGKRPTEENERATV
jgi:hypothetical protein